MRRLFVFLSLVVGVTAVYGQQLSLPFASPPYGRNGNLAVALEITPTLEAVKSGALGLSASIEAAPHHTSKFSLKGELSYFQMTATDLFGSGSFASGIVASTITTNIVDAMFIMRAYPTAQSINTFFFGLGMGATLFLSSDPSGSTSGPIFSDFTSNYSIQPQIEFETGYKFRLFHNFFVEPSANYKLSLPSPGLTFSANIPIYTFLTTSDSGPLSGVELSLSAGLEF